MEDEDWEDRHFTDADLIDHHNTMTESDQIHWEYSAHFEKSTDQEYNSQNNATSDLTQSLSIIIQTQDPSNIKHKNLNVYLPAPPDTDDLRRWHGRG